MKGEIPWVGDGIPPTEIRAVNLENRARVRVSLEMRLQYTKQIPKNKIENPWTAKKY